MTNSTPLPANSWAHAWEVSGAPLALQNSILMGRPPMPPCSLRKSAAACVATEISGKSSPGLPSVFTMPTTISSPSGGGREMNPSPSGASVTGGSVPSAAVSAGAVSATVSSTTASVAAGAAESDDESESLPHAAATSARAVRPAIARAWYFRFMVFPLIVVPPVGCATECSVQCSVWHPAPVRTIEHATEQMDSRNGRRREILGVDDHEARLVVAHVTNVTP